MDKHLKTARIITKLLETNFTLGNFRFGIEPLLGLIPFIGDFIGLIFSFYLVWIGRGMGLPEKEIARMLRNIVIDFVGGLIPFLGDIFDFAFKANTKNMKIIEKYAKSSAIQGKIIDSAS